MSLRGIAKAFGGTSVLSGVDLDLFPGEIHALVGANGAGKSTLGKIIAGYYRRDAGDLLLDGEGQAGWEADRALRAGVAMIHQEIQLVPGLSVADNIFLGQEQRAKGVFRRSNRERYDALEAQIGFGLSPEVKAGSLPLHMQQLVEIMRALARNARLIVMDEPTAALGPREAERLHAAMAELRARGCAIVYVTHFLEHVLDHCDRVTVLRDGMLVESREIAGLDRTGLIERMLGRAFVNTFPSLPPVEPEAATVLRAENVRAGTGVRGASINVRRGEIVGLLGLVGSGRSEILRAICGADPATADRLDLDGSPLSPGSLREAKRRGLVMVPEDRRGQGLLLDASVRANITLPYLHRFSRFGVVSRRRERGTVARHIAAFDVVPAGSEIPIRGHSGGNQQKILLARWLLDGPCLVMLDEPTRGVDVGARQRIYAAIADMARGGMAVVLVSSDLDEVLGLSHRAYLVRDGRTAGEVDPARCSADDVLRTLFERDERMERRQ